jgi:hypothetical protein
MVPVTVSEDSSIHNRHNTHSKVGVSFNSNFPFTAFYKKSCSDFGVPTSCRFINESMRQGKFCFKFIHTFGVLNGKSKSLQLELEEGIIS